MKSQRVSCKPEADTRFAVVTMTRMPYRFEEWLNYYRALGTDHLFIAVEESPEVELLLAEAPWCDMVTTSRSKPEQNPYETVITRQERVMAWALGECESRGIPWLFHLDDDELLHFGQPWEDTVNQVRGPARSSVSAPSLALTRLWPFCCGVPPGASGGDMPRREECRGSA